MILFDTSADEDININQMLLEKLKKMPGAIVSQAAVVTKDVPAPTTQSPTSEASRTLTASPTQEMDLMSVDLASLKPLIPAAIPEENSYFDIFVTLAASPSNFTVSLLHQGTLRKALHLSISIVIVITLAFNDQL